MTAAEKLMEQAVVEETRDARRSRRKRLVRGRTVSVQRMPKRDLELGRMLYPKDEHADIERPKTRANCKEGARPCPFVSCKHHLYIDVSPTTGAIKLNFPDVEVDAMTESCALDVADREGATLEEVGALMNITRERVRQLEVEGLAKIRTEVHRLGISELAEEGEYRPPGGGLGSAKRRLPILRPEDEEERDEGDADDCDAESKSTFDVNHFASVALDE